ncbi:hypothetical protein GCM10027589_07370 [Actinocorallia lasiicapitis]
MALQQLISGTLSVVNRRRSEELENQAELRKLFGREIAQARRVQILVNERLPKPSPDIEIRLVASPDAVEAVLPLEQETSRRAAAPDGRDDDEPVALAPMIEALRADLTR